jgi:hypothetical protein
VTLGVSYQGKKAVQKVNKGLPNTTKFYLLYRTTCFDLSQVILRFTVGEPEDDMRQVETCSSII